MVDQRLQFSWYLCNQTYSNSGSLASNSFPLIETAEQGQIAPPLRWRFSSPHKSRSRKRNRSLPLRTLTNTHAPSLSATRITSRLLKYRSQNGALRAIEASLAKRPVSTPEAGVFEARHGAKNGLESTFSRRCPGLRAHLSQAPHSHQVVTDHVQHEHLVHLLQPAHHRLSDTAN